MNREPVHFQGLLRSDWDFPHLPVQNDAPQQPQRQLVISIHDISTPDIHQFHLSEQNNKNNKRNSEDNVCIELLAFDLVHLYSNINEDRNSILGIGSMQKLKSVLVILQINESIRKVT